jgi:ferritin
MLKKSVQDALNEQIKGELDSAYLYLSMSAHCAGANLPGFAKWLRLQSNEELSHGMKLFDYLSDQGGRVALKALGEPAGGFESPLRMFQEVLEHERKVTAMIHRLYELALKEKDYATQVELQWFVREQVEEEKNASQILERVKLAGEGGHALLTLDQEMGARGGQA